MDPDADNAWVYRKFRMATRTSFDRGVVVDEQRYATGEVNATLRFKGDRLIDLQVRERDYRSPR